MGLDKALFGLVYLPQSESGAGARSPFNPCFWTLERRSLFVERTLILSSWDQRSFSKFKIYRKEKWV